ncbi:translation initiation factor IF-2-like [Mesocricetus auratus]|uniref:Translation initiation factor IF-2-like n=1 Tax=Mesocricetus auratus TaxID=10036 RepID=A0ABM2X8U3_MESAU|nr:translation initiation factor IF-2-like [Mesocricetus auratus]
MNNHRQKALIHSTWGPLPEASALTSRAGIPIPARTHGPAPLRAGTAPRLLSGQDLRAALAAAAPGSLGLGPGHAHPQGPPKPRDPIGQRIRAGPATPSAAPSLERVPAAPRAAAQGSGAALRHHLLTLSGKRGVRGAGAPLQAAPPRPAHLQRPRGDAASQPGTAAASRRAQELAGPRPPVGTPSGCPRGVTRAAHLAAGPPSPRLRGCEPPGSPSVRPSVPGQRRGLTAAGPTPRASPANGARPASPAAAAPPHAPLLPRPCRVPPTGGEGQGRLARACARAASPSNAQTTSRSHPPGAPRRAEAGGAAAAASLELSATAGGEICSKFSFRSE